MIWTIVLASLVCVCSVIIYIQNRVWPLVDGSCFNGWCHVYAHLGGANGFSVGGIKLGGGHVGGEETRRNLREKGVDMIKVQCIHV